MASALASASSTATAAVFDRARSGTMSLPEVMSQASVWQQAGQAVLFDREAVIVPGIRTVEVPGHNGSMCIVLIESRGATAVFWADLVPTVAHLPYPWVMGYDLFPLTTMENKQLWLPRAAQEDWLCVFEHDAETPVARLRADERGRFFAEPVLEPSAVLEP